METKSTSIKKMRTAAETVSSSPSTPPSWIELPEDVTANILQRLSAQERLESAQLVCTTWRKLCLDPAMWRVIELVPPDFDYADEYNLMCRCVVDRSQGQLISLRIAFVGDDELLHYIADQSNHLQRLTIVYCFETLGTALSQAVKKLPLLEELHLNLVNSVRAKDIEAIGISCPMLKSFSYHWSEDPMYPGEDKPSESKRCNEYALAIGKTMPNLRHLRLLANWMTNEGLEAVLDGCPHLESLDIRKCSGLNLTGALGKRCSQQITKLRDPSDPISDFEWLGVGDDESSYVEWGAYESTFSGLLDFPYQFGEHEYHYNYDYYYDYGYDLEVDGYDYF